MILDNHSSNRVDIGRWANPRVIFDCGLDPAALDTSTSDILMVIPENTLIESASIKVVTAIPGGTSHSAALTVGGDALISGLDVGGTTGETFSNATEFFGPRGADGDLVLAITAAGTASGSGLIRVSMTLVRSTRP